MVRTLAMVGVNMVLLPLWHSAHSTPAHQASQQAQQGSVAGIAGAAGTAGTPAAGSSAAPLRPEGLLPEAVEAAAAALRAHVGSSPDFGGKLFQQLAHGHPLLAGAGAAGGGQRSRIPYMSRDDAVVKTVAATLGR